MNTIKTWEDRWHEAKPFALTIRDDMQAEITELRKALKVAQEKEHRDFQKYIELGLSYSSLQAKLSAIEAQEPVAWCALVDGGTLLQWERGDGEDWKPLYAAPVAPAQPDWLLKSTQDLAKAIAKRNYPDVPQFEVMDDLAGVISQIDNMVCGMCRKTAQPVNELVEALRDAVAALGGINSDDVPETVRHALANTKAAQPLTKEQVEKVYAALKEANNLITTDSINEAIEIMKGVRG